MKNAKMKMTRMKNGKRLYRLGAAMVERAEVVEDDVRHLS